MTNIKQQLKEALQEFFSDYTIATNKALSSIKNKTLLSKKEVANLYGVSTNTIDAWNKKLLLPKYFKKGTRIFFIKEEIINQLKSNQNG
jgi:DNA-binding transcriptional MerR regulator